MPRNILIVDPSVSMRRILANMVLANVDDAVVYKAANITEASTMVKEKKFHILLFSWEEVDYKTTELLTTIQKDPQHGVPVVALVDGDQEQSLVAVKNIGIKEYVQAPCSAASLAEAITLACNPVNMRTNRRFSIPDTTASIYTESGGKVVCKVVNISSGGLLCELESPDHLPLKDMYSVTIHFDLGGRLLDTEGITAALSGMKVLDRQKGCLPNKIRLAFIFCTVPHESAEVLGQALVFAEQQEF